MALIYTPKGPAREYSELAINIYKGCGHHCKYCYAPNYSYMFDKEDKRKELFFGNTTIKGKLTNTIEQKKEAIMQKLRNAAAKFQKQFPHLPRVLMSFTSDPYQPIEFEWEVTMEAIQILGPDVPLTILTKAPLAALSRDRDLFVAYNIELATSLVWHDDEKRKEWEPDAEPVEQRLEALRWARELGLITWVSVEPILDADEGLRILRELIGKTDLIKIGIADASLYPEIWEKNDWPMFRSIVTSMMEDGFQRYLIKKRLREA